MNFRRLLPNPASGPDDAWAQTCPGDLMPMVARRQPPLQEVLHGLDSRELEGPTVFDQLFGNLPEPAPGTGRQPQRQAQPQPAAQANGRTPNSR